VNTKSAVKLAGLISASALLAPATLILGAAPMLAIRRAFGRAWFWLPLFAVAAGFFATKAVAAGVCMVIATILVGVYSEVEEHGLSIFNSAALGVLASVGAAAVGIGGYVLHTKNALQVLAHGWADKALEQFTAMNEGAPVTIEDLLQQAPSIVMIVLFITLWVALLWERPLRSLFRVAPKEVTTNDRLLAFRVPDLGVWVMIASIAGAFIKHGVTALEVASLNVFNVMVAIYFFQGLAVVACAFRQMKLGPGWRALWFVLLVVYLNFIVSLLGLVDFWIDFRDRMAREKPVRTDKFI